MKQGQTVHKQRKYAIKIIIYSLQFTRFDQIVKSVNVECELKETVIKRQYLQDFPCKSSQLGPVRHSFSLDKLVLASVNIFQAQKYIMIT